MLPKLRSSWHLPLTSRVVAGAAALLAAAPVFAQDIILPTIFGEPDGGIRRALARDHANEQFEPYTGQLRLVYTDLHIPGNGGLDLAVTRTFRGSKRKGIGAGGPGGMSWFVGMFPYIVTEQNLGLCKFVPLRQTGDYIQEACWDDTKSPVMFIPNGGRKALVPSNRAGVCVR